MAETNLSLAYRALISSGASKSGIVGSKDVFSTARKLGFDPKVILNGLVRGGYLIPVHFDGVYYLPEPDELETKFLRRRSYETVASACSRALGKKWYFGLNSALYFNGMIKQSPSEFIIITSQRLPSEFTFMGNKFRIRKFRAKNYEFEIRERGEIRFSSPARTLADYIYFLIKEGKQGYAVRFAHDLLGENPKIGKDILSNKLAGIYPPPFNIAVAKAAKQA